MGRRIELDPRLRGHGEISLVKALLRDRSAVARMRKIAKQFPEMVDVPLMKHPPFYESPGTATRPPEYSIEEHIPATIERARVEEYALELRKLAVHYGLRCDWIIGKLHSQIRHLIDPSFRILNIVTSVSHVIDYFKLDVPILPDTRKKDVLRQFKKEWQRIEANPLFRQRLKPPLDFNDVVEYLGLHLVFKWSSERVMEWQNAKETSPHYLLSDIETAIKKAARLLDVKLTRKRPRKAKKI